MATDSAQPDGGYAAPMNGIDASFTTALEWRLIGPHRGGRVVAVAGDPSDSQVFYFGATGGGVWKTTDGGWNWRNVSDGFFGSASIGAIAVSDADPNVVYVGTGESTIRSNVTYGDGVYKSTDRGRTWVHIGLKDTRQIGKIRVHPHDPDTVYVAALGHGFGSNPERGVYRSTDGGQSWEQVLYRSPDAGAIDLCLDPQNPRVLYASFWNVRRSPHHFSSGGVGGGLFKSTDGGDSWTELTSRPGLPAGVLGKIGLAVAPKRPDRVWAIIEAERGGIFRSDDGGASWACVNSDGRLQWRPFYYMHIFAGPGDENTVWISNLNVWKSTNAGTSFERVDTPHLDNHDLWIDATNPQRMILGNDGGACVSYNGGDTWSSIYNQPTAELYHVTTDNHVPYRVYGAQQDNTTICVPSLSFNGAITPQEWFVPGGGESGYIAVHPENPDIIYAGTQRLGVLTRYDRRTEHTREITIWPESGIGRAARDLKYRFNRTFPVVVSPREPSALYVGGNCVFRSTTEGESWQVISPDLTRNDRRTMGPSGGPITEENTGVEYYGTLSTLAASPHDPGVLWAGSDDGRVHVTTDCGQSWDDVTPAELPEWAFICMIDVSSLDPARAYLAATRYKLDDYAPYLYKTTDFGRTWEKIDDGIPDDAVTRVCRADPVCNGLLYVGTEVGIYVSFDDGGRWQRLEGNLPVVAVHDLVVKNDDLVAATHGRSFWILDDVTPLRQLSREVLDADAFLFPPRSKVRFRINYEGVGASSGTYRAAGALGYTTFLTRNVDGSTRERLLDAGENPPDGVLLTYYMREVVDERAELVVMEEDGTPIRRFTLSPEPGLNRVVWDMRYPGPSVAPADVFSASSTAGPLAPPGRYRVELQVGGDTHAEAFDILPDPRLPATPDDYRAQFELLLEIRDRLSAVHEGVHEIRDLRRQLTSWIEQVASIEDAADLRRRAAAILDELSAVEEELIQVRAHARHDRMRYPVMLNSKLAVLNESIAFGNAAPTAQSREVFAQLAAQVDQLGKRLARVREEEVTAFNNQAAQAQIPLIVVSQRADGQAQEDTGVAHA